MRNEKMNEPQNQQSCQDDVIFVAYQTFLKESVTELLKAEKSIVKDGYVKITIDEEYKCSDDDLKRKWFIY